MKTRINSLKLGQAALLSLIICTILTGSGSAFNADSDSVPPATKKELNRAKRATARYHNVNHAIADGYIDINVFFPNMGYHYLKPSLLDAEFDPEKPELLVYADFGNGHLRLVAVEYAVPTALSATPPAGFTGDDDDWHRNDDFGLWTLHAWIWHPNPDGVFADFNPRVP